MTKKEKALLGISIVSAVAAGYLSYKYNLDTSKLKVREYAKKTYYIMREETAVFTPVATECIRYQR